MAGLTEGKHKLIEIGAALLISLGVFGLSFTSPYQRLELLSLDARFNLRPRIETNPDIATIDIDDRALSEEGRWQDWTRDKHTRIVEIIREAGGSLLGFDIYFAEKSEKVVRPEDVRKSRSIDEVWAAFRDYDTELAQALERSDSVFLGATFVLDEEGESPSPAAEGSIDTAWERLGYLIEKGHCIRAEEAVVAPILRAVAPQAIPIPSLIEAAKGVGFAQIVREADGLVRKYPTLIRIDYPPGADDRATHLVPSLALAMACEYLQVPLQNLVVRPGEYLEIPGAHVPALHGGGGVKSVRIPINEKGEMIINWAGDYKETFRHYPYSSLIRLSERRTLEQMKELLSRSPSLYRNPAELMRAVREAFPHARDAATYVAYLYGAYWYETLIEEQGLQEFEPHVFERLFGLTREENPALYETQEEVFENVRLNHAVLELLSRNRGISMAEAVSKVDGQKEAIEDSYRVTNRLLSRGGPTPADADRPLFFLPPLTVEGKPISLDDLKYGVFFYGLTAAGTHDLNPMPFSPRYPMVGAIANVFNTIVTQQPIRSVPKILVLPLLVAVGLFTGYVLSTRSSIRGSLFTLLFLVAYLLFAYWLFADRRIWIEVVGPAATIVLSDAAIVWYKFSTAEKDRKFIKRAFEYYLNPSVVEQIANNPEMLELGGKEMELTAFFSDIAGFTTISEQLAPPQLVELLNEYLTAMTDIVLKYEGLLDKYEGDAILAVFGAPIHFPDHATRASFVALEMQAELGRMREKWKAEGRPELHARIGINSGPMVVGNMGSRTRFDYTVMGDAVNLASRLEGVNKQYSTRIMMSEFTFELCRSEIIAREVDLIRVKGKTAPVKIYELLARTNDGLPGSMESVIEQYTLGLDAYRRRQWEVGIRHFEQALGIKPDDGPSLTYLGRCREYLTAPPPDDWDGVYVMTSK